MKIKFVVILCALILSVAAACGRSVPADPNNSAAPPTPAANVNANAVGKEREDLEREAEKVKKDLDELEKKLADANAESREMQKKIRDVQKQIDETEKKIR